MFLEPLNFFWILYISISSGLATRNAATPYNDSLNSRRLQAQMNPNITTAEHYRSILQRPVTRTSVSFPLYGSVHNTAYWFADVYFGYPNPQRQSLIVDTGSSVMGFPCSDCQTRCGKHIDPPFNRSSSLLIEPIDCIPGCLLCARHNAQDSVSVQHTNSSFGKGQCAYHIKYTEGSSLMGRWFQDGLWLNYDPKNKKRSLDAVDRILVPFGCHSEETHLFVNQDASGILGLEPDTRYGPQTFVTSVLNGLLHQHVANPTMKASIPARSMGFERVSDSSPVKPQFAMCLSQSGGVLTLGGSNEQYHVSKALALRREKFVPPVAQKNHTSFIMQQTAPNVEASFITWHPLSETHNQHPPEQLDRSPPLSTYNHINPVPNPDTVWQPVTAIEPPLPSSPIYQNAPPVTEPQGSSGGNQKQFYYSSYITPKPRASSATMVNTAEQPPQFGTNALPFPFGTAYTSFVSDYDSSGGASGSRVPSTSTVVPFQSVNNINHNVYYPMKTAERLELWEQQHVVSQPTPGWLPASNSYYSMQPQPRPIFLPQNNRNNPNNLPFIRQQQKQIQRQYNQLQRLQRPLQYTGGRRRRADEQVNADQSIPRRLSNADKVPNSATVDSNYPTFYVPKFSVEATSDISVSSNIQNNNTALADISSSTRQAATISTPEVTRGGISHNNNNHNNNEQHPVDQFVRSISSTAVYPLNGQGVQWTPMAASLDEEGRYDSYLILIEAWALKGSKLPEIDISLPIIPRPDLGTQGVTKLLTRRHHQHNTNNSPGLLALVDSGTTLTYLPFLVYARLWTSMIQNISKSKKAASIEESSVATPQPPHRSLLDQESQKNSDTNNIVRISGHTMGKMKRQMEQWIRRLESKSRILQQKKRVLLQEHQHYYYSFTHDEIKKRRLDEDTTLEDLAEIKYDALAIRELKTILLSEKRLRYDLLNAKNLFREMSTLEVTLQEEALFALQNSKAVKEASTAFESNGAIPRRKLFNNFNSPKEVLTSSRSSTTPSITGEKKHDVLLTTNDDDISPSSLSSSSKRQLSAVALPNLDEECWFLTEGEKDLRHFPDLRLMLAGNVEYIWRPHSYLYRKGKTRVFCLTFVSKEDEKETPAPSLSNNSNTDTTPQRKVSHADTEQFKQYPLYNTKRKLNEESINDDDVDDDDDLFPLLNEEVLLSAASLPKAELKRRLQHDEGSVVLGSSFFINHDLIFNLGSWTLGITEAACPTTDIAARSSNFNK